MKKFILLAALCLLLTGCGAQETLETVSDVYVQPVSAVLQHVILELPDDAHVTAMEGAQEGSLYLCDGYTVTVQTVEAGDLDKTLRTVTGFGREDLQIMETAPGGIKRYECVWTAAGEGEDQVGRACVLDDGSYHYVVTAMAGESDAGTLRDDWQTLFDSFRLSDTDVNTGS